MTYADAFTMAGLATLATALWIGVDELRAWLRRRRVPRLLSGVACFHRFAWTVEWNVSGGTDRITGQCQRCTATRAYFGSCTVWHEETTGKRLPSAIERELADVWALERYRRGRP